MHGLGNDFVIMHKHDIANVKNFKPFIERISDRRLGIGCDQVITYEENGAEYIMSIYNQDGSSAEACGNGTRCLAQLIGKREVVITVLNRTLKCTLNADDTVTVNMGKVSFQEKWMPNESTLWDVVKLYDIDPRDAMCVSMGNPHLVLFKSNLSYADKKLIGHELEKHRIFPSGVNVNFANLENNIIKLMVWERGDGFTLACGSGACASFAAAKKMGFVGIEAVVRFEHGDLLMSSTNDEILMTGPTTTVAEGLYYID